MSGSSIVKKEVNITNIREQSSRFIASTDVQLAIALIGIVFVMVIPLPPLVLDVLLCISISISVLILLIGIYIKEPLELSTFPTILLMTTLFRLALNVATTRNILLQGALGQVSQVINSFGNFVVGGNYFVGFVVFTILVVINFIVITKGAGRVAEVSARFTLDAMPGKQMAIDADLNAGLIDREEAKLRRLKIEKQADFYGAMDGASKFVRGDAIAGIIITVINIVVGFIIGITTYKMSFADSARTFTLLTVGDGLVSQIPALLISTAAGIVVTRSGVPTVLSETLNIQIASHSKALYICGAMLLGMGILPGLPFIPFAVMSSIFGLLGYYAAQSNIARELAKSQEQERAAEVAKEETVESILKLDILTLEVGVGLIPLVDSKQDGEILERIVSARKQFAHDLGIIVPMVMVKDNIQLRPGEYQILLKGNPVGRGNLMVDYYLAMDPGDILEPIEGIPTKEPAYGLDALWIKPSQRDEATFRGYTVVNCSTIVVTHLTKIIEENAKELLGRQETQQLIEQMKQYYPKVVEEVMGTDKLSLSDIVKVLQNLLAEKVSIRDLLTIFETLADYCKIIKNPDALTRYVRKSLGRSIVRKYLSSDDVLVVLTLDRAVEDLLVAGLQQKDDGATILQIDPPIAQKILNNIAKSIDLFQTTGTQPILLCGSLIRWDLRQLVSRFIPEVVILAFDEVPSDIKTQSIGIITLQ